MAELTDDIRKAIEQHLPEQVGTMLKERLATVESLETRLATITAQRDAADKKCQQQLDQLNAHVTIDQRTKQLNDREAVVAKREADATLNEFKVKAADAAKCDVLKLAEIVFKNPTYTRDRYISRQVPDQYGNTKQMTDSVNETEGIQ